MVKSASHVVDAVTDHERPINYGRLSMDLQAECVSTKFGGCLFNDRIGIDIQNEGIDGYLERVKVFFCSGDFSPIAN